MPDELLDLFANIPGVDQFLSVNGGTSGGADGLAANPEHGGVTDEQVQAYFANRLGRVGPPPVISSQQVPAQPQFLPGQGSHTAPQGGLESGGESGGQEVIPGRVEGQQSEQQGQGQPEPSAPVPSTPSPEQDQQEAGSESIPPPEPPQEIEYGDQRIPRARLDAWIEFQQTIDNDPRLRSLLQTYFTAPEQLQPQPQPQPSPQPYPGYPPVQPLATQPTQQQPAQAQPFTAPPPAPPTFPQTPQLPQPGQVPQLSPDDLADPAVAALYAVVQQQNAQISALSQAQQFAQQQAAERAQAEHTALINRATESFQREHNLNADQMRQIQQVAGRLQVIPSLLQGIDPTTGLPSRPDPLSALDRAFEIAYGQIPEFAQVREQEIIARHSADQERKRRLSALSGNGGSVPRTTPAPTTAEGRAKALHDEVAAMFQGTWSEPSN